MNMGYCRFENTLNDLRDCADALDEGRHLSRTEHEAACELVAECQRILDLFEGEDPADAIPKEKP
jgi:hypothetical protein